MKYGIITDIHNNVIALRAVLKRLDQMNCSRIICCGDIIGIGPYPEETVQEIAGIPGLMSVRGNHDGYLLEGIPTEYPNEENMSPGEMEHHRWEHNLLSAESVAFLRSMPNRIDFSSEGFDISVMHSCMDRNGHFSGSKKIHPNQTCWTCLPMKTAISFCMGMIMPETSAKVISCISMSALSAVHQGIEI